MTAMYAVPPPGIPYWTWLHARGVLEAVIQAAHAGQVTTAHPVPAQNYPQWLAAFRIRPLPPPLASPAPVGDEIADVLLFTLAIADMLGIDAGQAVAEKIRVNARRAYRTMPNGTRVKHDAGPPATLEGSSR